jgi:hypothetical protein
MGIHTAEPTVGEERYVGLGVHRAARICAAGHGGQVLVSQTSRELLRADPLSEVSLRDLGAHQLKDLDEPEQLYQLVAPGLAESFPGLKAAGPTPFAGREGELADYHGTSQATGGNPRQRISHVLARSAPIGFATDCHRLQPRGSIKAPSSVVGIGYVAAEERIGPRAAAHRLATGCHRLQPRGSIEALAFVVWFGYAGGPGTCCARAHAGCAATMPQRVCRRRLWLCLVDARARSSSRPSRPRGRCRHGKRSHQSASAAVLVRLLARLLIRG